METRQVTEVKIYKLIMNSVYDRAEVLSVVAISDDYDRLCNFYRSQLIDPEVDEYGYLRHFKEGELRNYNPVYDLQLKDYDDRGISSEWIPLDQYDKIRYSGSYNGIIFV